MKRIRIVRRHACARGRRNDSVGADLSEQTDPHRRAVSGGRPDRHDDASARAEADRRDGQSRGGGQSRRRQRHHRHRQRRQVAGRRLFAGGRLGRRVCDRAACLFEAAVRRVQGFRAGEPVRHAARIAGGASVVAGEVSERTGRARQAAAEPVELRFVGHRQHAAPRRGASEERGEYPDGARSVQGHGAGNHGSDRRTVAARLRRHAGALAAGKGRQTARTRGRLAAALAEPAGRADHERSRLPAGRSLQLVRAIRSGRHAEGDHCATQRRNRQGDEQPRREELQPESGRHRQSSTPEELAALHKREYDKWGGVVKAAGIKPE